MPLLSEAEKFANAAKKLNEGNKQDHEEANLGGSAQQFSDNAAKLAEKLKPADPTLDPVAPEEQRFAGAAKDLNAQMYAEANIIPKIDGLIDAHKDGSGIPRNEIESTFKDIMNQMVQENVMTQEEMTAYTAPSKEPVPKSGLLSRLQKTQYVDAPSRFENDIDQSMNFPDGKLESPNLESFKDKLMNTLSKVCNSLGLKDLAKSCRQSISKPNLEKTYAAEKGMSNLVSKVADQAKAIGNKVGSPEAKRVSNRAQDILAKRQQTKNDGQGR